MRSTPGNSERRAVPRFTGQDMKVSVRQQGRIARTHSTALDFNRFGVAVLTQGPLEKAKPVFLTLECRGLQLENVVGVVHNCIAQDGGYRCGIQFRTQSTLQFDRNLVERTLQQLEIELLANPGDEAEQISAAQ
jgi:hypothetical protein